MLHDTFCTPSTFDKLNIISETCINNTTLRVDTLFRPSNNYISPPPLRSSNSSLTTASSISSSDDASSTNNELISWVQRQLEFYTALSILPRFSCIDDGKVLLCLIHRFTPSSLPSLVATLEQHTTIECLLLADDLAQTLWHTTIDTLAIHLYRHHLNTSTTSTSIGDYVDSLTVPHSGTPDQSSKDQLLCNSDDDDDDHYHYPYAQQPAVINATTLPIWQLGLNDGDTMDATRCWMTATHQSIDSYLHHPHTRRLSVLLSLLDQLRHIYVDFTRLSPAPATCPDLILPTRQLLDRLQVMDAPFASLTKSMDDDDNDLGYLLDVLVQRHACLRTGIRHTLGLFEKADRVQTWVAMQSQQSTMVDVVRQYQQEDSDVVALTQYVSSPSLSFGTAVAKPVVIRALDRLDTMVSQSKRVARWHAMAVGWKHTYGVAYSDLVTLNNSVQRLKQQATWNNNETLSHRSLLQQWKILSNRVALVGGNNGSYASVLGLYQQLASATAATDSTTTIKASVDSDYGVFIQQWKQLQLDLDSTGQRIAQHKRIEDFLHQCRIVQVKADELEKLLGVSNVNLYEKPWLEDQVAELDVDTSRVLALTDGLMTAVQDDDNQRIVDDLIQYWKDTLARCNLACHQALVHYQSKCTQLERQQELNSIKQNLSVQWVALQSTLFDPWTHGVDDLNALKQDYVERKLQFEQTVVAALDQCIMHDASALSVKQLLMDYEHRLDILEKRHSWEHQWRNTSTWIQQTSNALHTLVASGDNGTLDDIQQQVWGYKHNLERVQQAWDDLLAMHKDNVAAVNRMCQRQQLLRDQVTDLDGLLDATRAVLGQSTMVNAYMNSVDGILKHRQSLRHRLEESLLSTRMVQGEETQTLASSVAQLWQHSGSQIPYPASFLVVDDLVRWKVLMAYGGAVAAVEHLMAGELDAHTKRMEWEKQWQLDMDGLNDAQCRLSLWLQQLDFSNSNNAGVEMMEIVDKYTDYSFHPLEQLFTSMQQAYPSNIKIPLALKQQQQQLTVDRYSHVKSLCVLVTYLQTAKQLEDKCDDMNATLDQYGANALEAQVQQWVDDIKVHVERKLFGTLCERQLQLQDGVGMFGKEKVLLVHDKARKRLADLQHRLSTTLKALQHAQLVQDYETKATVLESSLQCLQDDLICWVREHDKLDCDAEDVLPRKWKEAKLALETTHAVSYHDVRSRYQLIQLQQHESSSSMVDTRQSQLDALWQVVGQDIDGVQERILSLAQWRDVSSSLDKVQMMLAPLDQWVDTTTMAVIVDKDDGETLKALSRGYQEAHATLVAVGGVFPCAADEHNNHILRNRFNELCSVVNGLRTALLCFAQTWVVDGQGFVLNRLTSWMDIALFDVDGDDDTCVVVRHWNKLKASSSTYDLVVPLLSLCQNKPLLNNGKGDGDDTLLDLCWESSDGLSRVVDMERNCLKGVLSSAYECGRQASELFMGLDQFAKDLAAFSLTGTTNELVDWRLDIHVWKYKMAHYEKTELHAFLTKVKDWILLVDDQIGVNDDFMKTLGDHVRQCMHGLLQGVESRWQKIKTPLTEVTSWQLKKEAERQWQDLLDLLEHAGHRMTVLVSGFYHDDPVAMMNQEQDLVEAQQALTTLVYEQQPVLEMKANKVNDALDAMTTNWIDHGDVDRVLNGWEQTVQQHKQHLRHNLSMCQYWTAAAEVQGYLHQLEQQLLMAEGGKAKAKVYMEALDISLEKTRQAAMLVEGSGRTEYALLVAKRNKLERQYNTSSVAPGLRSRKISLPAKMPSQNLMGRMALPPMNAYVADPHNELDMEIGRIVNRAPYKVELNMVPGEAGRYRFGAKLVYCRILKSRMVMVRVGGGWTELSQFLRDHALLVGNVSTSSTTTTSADGYQQVFLDTKRATSPTSGRPMLLPRMSQSTSITSSSISGNAGYKDGDRYIAVDLQGHQHEMKMTPHDSNHTTRRY